MGLVIWLLTGGALTMCLSLLLLHWPVMFILAGGFVATALICVSILVPKSQLEQAPKSFRYVLILGGGLGLGMFLQTVPLELFGLANPLWSAAGAAIGKPMAGYITVDTASTVVGLTKYLVMLGTGLAVALACSDQKRSAQMAYEIVWLLAIFLVINAGFNELQSAEMKARFWAEWTSLSTLGILIIASIIVRFQVRHSSRRVSPNPWTSREYFRPFVVWVGAIALFALPLFKHGSLPAAIPAVCGISALLAVVLVKRLASGTAGVLFAVALVVCGLWFAGLTTGIVGLRSSKVLGSHSETEIATVIRVFGDFRWFGSGIGTYSRVVPMYAGLQDGGKSLFEATPTALSLLIELGMPLALLASALLFALAWAVFSRVARNNRDYSHAMLACSTLLYLVAAALTPGLSLSFSTMVVASMIIGLGLTAAQRPLGIPGSSQSRSTVRPRSTSEHVGSSRSKAAADDPAPR